ncbi:MAG: hypothetical protein ACE5IM_01450 [Nitrospinota bacterium]
MRRILSFTVALFLALSLAGCGPLRGYTSPSSAHEPMSEEEIQRYRDVFYLKMTPAQRSFYESMLSRRERDQYLRDLGLLKDKERRTRKRR